MITKLLVKLGITKAKSSASLKKESVSKESQKYVQRPSNSEDRGMDQLGLPKLPK